MYGVRGVTRVHLGFFYGSLYHRDTRLENLTPIQHSPSLYNLSYILPCKCQFQFGLNPICSCLFSKVQVIVQPLAGRHSRHVQTGGTVGQRCVEEETPDGGSQDDQGGDPARNEGLATHALPGGDEAAQTADGLRLSLAGGVVGGRESGTGVEGLQVENEFNQSSADHRRCQVGGQVVVQEALTAHQPEGEEVSGPAKEQKSGAVVQTRAGAGAPD